MSTEIPRYHRPPGLPDRAWVISNSERSTAACRLRWLYRYGLGLRRQGAESRPLRMGDAVHRCLEEVFRYWRVTDDTFPGLYFEADGWMRTDHQSPIPGKEGPSTYCRIVSEWAEHVKNGDLDPSDTEDEARSLWSIVRGYLFRYGLDPHPDYKVVGVEQQLCAPIHFPGGGPYAPEMPVVEDGGLIRPAVFGDEGVQWVRWPWYQVLTVDVLMQHRKTGALVNFEHKTSQSVREKFRALRIDPQTTGYCWALRWQSEQGLIPLVAQGATVSGWIYDVMSSKPPPEPKLVKSGKRLSKQGTPTTWGLFDAITRHGLDPNEYRNRMIQARTRDAELYQREFWPIGQEEILRYEEEVYGIARQHAQMRRDLFRLKSLEDLHIKFPRTPVCASRNNGCGYMQPCLAGELEPQGYNVTTGLHWRMDATDSGS